MLSQGKHGQQVGTTSKSLSMKGLAIQVTLWGNLYSIVERRPQKLDFYGVIGEHQTTEIVKTIWEKEL